MASRFAAKNDIHFDSTTGTIELEGFGEIPGVEAFTCDPGEQEPGSVVAVGSETEVGVTPGEHKPGKGKMRVHLGAFAPWIRTVQDQLGGQPYRRKLFTWTCTWAHLDEEQNPMPSQTASFQGFLTVPGAIENDRTQAGKSITIEIPIRILGRVTLNGVEL